MLWSLSPLGVLLTLAALYIGRGGHQCARIVGERAQVVFSCMGFIHIDRFYLFAWSTIKPVLV